MPKANGPVHVLCLTLRNVIASAMEAELGGLFENCQKGEPIRVALEEMGHPQPPTPVATDNTTAVSVVKATAKQKRSRAIDMRFYWVRDRMRQKHFHIFWESGKDNWADYFTKHHPTYHHRGMRPKLLKPTPADIKNAQDRRTSPMRGCVKTGISVKPRTGNLSPNKPGVTWKPNPGNLRQRPNQWPRGQPIPIDNWPTTNLRIT